MCKIQIPSNNSSCKGLMSQFLLNSNCVWKIRSKMDSRDPFHEVLMSWWLKLCFNYESNDKNCSRFCTCHNSSAVVACAKFWPDLIIIFQITTSQFFLHFFNHKLYITLWCDGLQGPSFLVGKLITFGIEMKQLVSSVHESITFP